MKREILLIGTIFLSGCVAETVERKKPRRGPIKEVGYVDMGAGNIRYSVEGVLAYMESRKIQAGEKPFDPECRIGRPRKDGSRPNAYPTWSV